MTILLKVAHFIETDIPGGAEKILFDLCKNMKNHNLLPIVIHFGSQYFIDQCEKNNIQQIVISNRFFKNILLLPFFAIELAFILRKNKIDILHSHLFGPITGAAFGAFLSNTKHIGTLHDTYMIEEKPMRIYLLRLSVLFKTKLVCVSKDMQRFYLDKGIPSKATKVIYNSVKEPSISSHTHNMELLESLDITIGLDTPIFFTAGRLIQLKRIEHLIIAAKKTISSGVNIVLLIAGEGPEYYKLKNLIDENCLGDYVKLLGHRTDIADLMRLSTAYVQCSETEGLSMSILEAMACKTPCIVSDVGANRELVIDGVSGSLFEYNDIKMLARIMAKYAQKNNITIKQGTAAHELFLNKFAHEKMIDSYTGFYRSTL